MYNDKDKSSMGMDKKNKIKTIKLAISATFTSEPIRDYIEWWGEQFGYDIEVKFADYNQVFQELANEHSLISTNEGANLILVRFEDWVRNIGDLSDIKKIGKLEEFYGELIELFEAKPKPVPYFVGIFPVSTHLSLSEDLLEYVEEMYTRWQEDLEEIENVYIINFIPLKEHYRCEKIFDPVSDHQGHLPFTGEYYAAMGTNIARKICGYIENNFKEDTDKKLKSNQLLPMQEYTALDLQELLLKKVEDETVPTVDDEAPGNETERKLAEVWEKVLRRRAPGVNSSFFALGGDSLKVVILIAEIHKVFNVELSMNDVFGNKSIKEMSILVAGAEKSIYEPIESVGKRNHYPLSSAQMRLYILNQMEPDSVNYNIPKMYHLKEEPDRDRLKEAFQKLIERHETFRTSIDMSESQPVQKIHEYINFEIEHYNAHHCSIEDKAAIDSIMKDFVRPFNLSRAPLIRAGIMEAAEKNYFLMVDMHHIISDGITYEIFKKELMELYELKELPQLNIQYKDFSEWEKKEKIKVKLKKEESYWVGVFGEINPVLSLEADYTRPAVQSFEGDTIFFELEKPVIDKLKNAAKKEGATLFMMLWAAFNILIMKLSGQEDVIVGTPVGGRTHPDLENIIGMFVNTLAIRSYPKREKMFLELLGEVKQATLEAFENQEYPFEELVDVLNVERDASRNPLFDVMFVLQNMESESVDKHMLKMKPYKFRRTASRLDMTIFSEEINEGLSFEWEYCTKLFKVETIQRFIKFFKNILNDVIKNPVKKLSEIEILSTEDKEQVLYDFNRTEAGYPENQTIHQLFAAQVEKTPVNVAVMAHSAGHEAYSGEGRQTPGARRQAISYRQLNEKANQLARHLRERGIGPNIIAGIMVEPSLDMVVAVMAILKAGGAYLPIPPEAPQDHIHFLLKNSKCHSLLTREKYIETIDFSIEVVRFEDESLYQGSKGNLDPVNSPRDLACVIYSTVSTGEPKGVMMEHGAIINTLWTLHRKYPGKEPGVYLYKTPYQFDVSIAELFGWFPGGGSLVISEPDGLNDPGKILETVHEQKITHIHFVPTLFNQFTTRLNPENVNRLASLEYIFLSGEMVLPEVIKRFNQLLPSVAIEILYGFPEVSVSAAAYSLSGWDGSGSIPIGKPLSNTKIYILDFESEEPMPAAVGIPGELCVSGIGLARGYLEETGLTEKRFMDNPFAKPEEEAYKKLFRTGELAFWLPYGNIRCLGRMDREVNIRGNRIDRSEIESKLLENNKIREVVVVTRSDNEGKIYFCAYVVSDEILDTIIIRDKLSEQLPAPMIPTYIIQIEQIPLTLDGKADRVELLDIKHEPHQIEEILAEIEAEVLRLDKADISLDDNFFQLGGHSYNANQVAAKIHKAFNVKISMAELFKRPTLRQLSEFLTEAIEAKYTSIQPAESSEYYPQSSAQKRLYFLQQLEEESTVYNIQMMDIYCKGIEKQILEEAFKKLIKRHESLRTSFHVIDGESLQKINDYEEVDTNFKVEYYETTEEGLIYILEPGNNGPASAVPFTMVIESFVKPFDLSKAPLLRIGFIKIWGDTKILMMDMHHTIADGISMGILATELWELYDGEELPGLRLQYKDFSQWLNRENRVEAAKELETFWLKEFEGEIPLINLPTDYPRPAKMSFDGDTQQFEISKEDTHCLSTIAEAHAESVYMVLFAMYSVLLAKISGQEDIIVGTVTAGRGNDDLKNIVGMFVNTLALRNYPEAKKSFKEFLTEIKLTTFAALENQDYPFEQLVSQVAPRQDMSRNPLFDVAFGLENETDPTGYLGEVAIPDKSKPYDFGPKKAKFDMTMVCVELEDGMECTIEYKTKLFKPETIRRFVGYFQKIISSVCSDIWQKIGEIEIISEEEKSQILHQFNDTRVEYPRDKTIQECFEERVKETPGNIALSYKGKTLTYHEFNEKANKLAKELREKGVKPNHMVGIMVERSLAMIIGIFAILKAGGAYLPIDPNYPKDRIGYLFKDSSAKLLLTLEKFIQFAGTVDFEGEVINLEEESLYHGETRDIVTVNSPNDLAYIIYTSGSTGKPKGVMIEHVSAVNLLMTLDKMYPLEKSDAYLLKTAFLFDVSVSEIFGWYWRGGRLTILEPGLEKDPLKMIDKIEEEKITHINFVPSLFNIFVDILDSQNITKLSCLRYIFLAGEAIWPESINKFRSFKTNVIIENIYGPTEATVYASWYPVAKWKGSGSVSIGKPVDNLNLYILSSDDTARPHLQPVGIAGELTISGIGLARGYLNRPELTAEKFVDNPFAGEEHYDETFKKLYHTGDLTRWYYDGNIEYMGRIDFQVKVRGFRIELGEIETRILNLDEVKETVVIAREDNEGEKYLCAYLIPEPGKKLNMSSVRKILSENIPDYMIPSYFVEIEKIPLNPNGKLDRKALPVPEIEAPVGEFAAPTNEIEEILAGLWSDVLGTTRIGIDDNFFEIGGDSIKAIQIVSRLQKNHLNLEVSQMFTHKTVRQLGKYIKPLEGAKIRIIDQGVVEGNVELTPIQKWLLTHHKTHAHHFNQSVTLYRKEGFDDSYIEKVFAKILEHHDALRMVYQFGDEGYHVVQENRGISGRLFHLEVIPLEKEEDERAVIKRDSFRIQSSIDLHKGPLVKLGLFKGKEGEGDHLLIVIHHLVVDGICWRILLEDFETGYLQAAEAKEITFRNKTDSFKHWAQKLSEYAESKELLSQLPYWKKLEDSEIKPLPADNVVRGGERKFRHHDIVHMVLSKEKTGQLLTKVNRAYNTEINDILLTALGLAVKEWADMDKILVSLEGHGREEIAADIDITRTVGWFTTQYPVILNLKKSDDLSYSIRNVKETLRRVPQKGIGYGILKYLTPKEKIESLQFKHTPHILFNYLGKFGGENYEVIDGISGITDLSIEDCVNPEMEMTHKIDIEGVIEGKTLKFLLFYNKLEYKRESIQQLSETLQFKLEQIIEHCQEKKESAATPSDLGCKYLSIEELEIIKNHISKNISREMEIELIYLLNPMQSGILYHTLHDEKSDAYLEHMVFTLHGEIEKSLLEESFNRLISRYDVFRTIFIHEGLYEPLQVLLKDRKTTLHDEDIAHLNKEEQQRYLEESRRKQRERGYDLSRDILIRFSLFKTGMNTYVLDWGFHHIIMDGWCLGIVIKELRQIYQSLETGGPLKLETVTPYVEYINWLNRQDQEEGLAYWEKYLEGYEEPASLPIPSRLGKEHKYKLEEYHFDIDEELTASLNKISMKNQVTVSTAVHTIWGILLQKYNNRNDVVFGTIVSGRTPEIEGIDRMVGLFINLIPVRIKNTNQQQFSQLLRKVQEESASSKKYEFLSVAEIQAQSDLKGDLIDHIMVFENYPVQEELKNPELGFTVEGMEAYEQTNYDFNIAIMPRKRLHISFSYNSLVYARDLIESVARHFQKTFRRVVDNPGINIEDIEIITGEEKNKILYEFNDTKSEYPNDKTIQEIFEAQMEKTSGNTALIFQDNKLNYMELNKKANQLARELRKKGVKPDQFLGLMVERSMEMIIAMMAVLKAGGAYLPIDPDYPQDRIRYLLDDSDSHFLLTQKKFVGTFDFDGETIDIEEKSLYQGETQNLTLVNSPTHLAYSIYTSGSTGKPKGVMIEHYSVINLAFSQIDSFGINETERIFQFSSICFDASVEQIYIAIFSGAALVLIDKEVLLDMGKFENFIDENGLTHIHGVPAFVSTIPVKKYKNLKRMISGGDVCPPFLVKKWIKYCDFCNEYGPTETTVTSIQLLLQQAKKFQYQLSIGRPLNNTFLYILDKHTQPVPMGVAGELCIGGDGVARGYLNRPELTAEKFIPLSFVDGGRMYRTGDLSRWLEDGNIDFLGRIDFQVKVRGFRIETGEIENQILAYKDQDIKDAVVIAREDIAGEKYLCAYLVADEKVDISALETGISEKMPDYMIPSYFVQIEKIPLTPNGKVDRKALPTPEIKDIGADYAAPRDDIEERMVEIWSQLLHIDKKIIGIDNNFFRLGGHSLKAAVMITMIHKNLNVKVVMHQVFEMPTIRSLCEYIKSAKKEEYFSIEPAEKKEYYLQTSAQKRLYFMDQLQKDSILYNIQLMDVYCKGIEKQDLEETFRKLIKRHESLRASFFNVDGQAVQRIHDIEEISSNFEIEYWETDENGMIYSEEPGKAWTKATDLRFQEVIEYFVRPFDLTRPPLIRAGFIKIWGNTKILMLDMHHTISDGVSNVTLIKDLWDLYEGEGLPKLRVQYRDFSEWINGEEQKKEVKRLEIFWKKDFSGEIPVLNLPYDYPRPATMTFEGDMLHFEISKEETRKLNKIARAQDQTLYMVLLAAYYVLLAKLSGQEDIVVGTVTAGRGHADLQPIIGMFVETLALRNYPESQKSFIKFTWEVKQRTLSAFEHQAYPFEQLVSLVAPRQDKSRNPLFDALFVLENEAERSEEYLHEVLMLDRSNPYKIQRSKFDLTISGAEMEDGLQFNLEYNTQLFKEETIERFIMYFKQIVSSICKDLEQQISEIDIMPDLERGLLLYGFNDTESLYPKDRTIHEMFEEQAVKNPGNTAVEGMAHNPWGTALTYKELNAKANQLARKLMAKGIKSEDIAAIMVEPCQEMIIGLLGILKAGAAFLPIKDGTPADRIKYILQESGTRFLLTREELLEGISFEGKVINLDYVDLYSGDESNLHQLNDPGDLAYIIYTSGSTGKPKGVMVEHRSLVNLCSWHNKYYSVTANDHATKYAGFGFDASVWEVFPYLVIGAAIYIVPEEIKLDIEKLNGYFQENGITISFLPTQICEQFMTIDNNSLRVLLTGGDKLKIFVKRNYRLYNNYGPTENTVVSTSCLVTKITTNIPIGKPLFNNQIYILDKNDNLQPIGVPGELSIGGDSLARGYLNNPKLTMEKFVKNPYTPPAVLQLNGSKLYRTGDLVRWLADGNIEFLGRIDYQVKIRGFRIELGEIENQLLHIKEIKEAVVIGREDTSGQKYLCAYIVPEKEEVNTSGIKNTLLKILPDYMVPSYFVQLPIIPLNPNGKIDTKALPEPETKGVGYAAPTNEMEEIISGIWSEVLGMEKISIDDSFFEIGGDSIKTIMISGKLLKLNLGINVNDFFLNPTIRQLAKHIKKIERKTPQGMVEGNVQLTPIQQWFFHREFKEKHHFNHVVMLQSTDRLDEEIVKKVFAKILEHHDALRMVYEVDEEPGKIFQKNRGLQEGKLFDLEVIDLRDKKEFDKELKKETQRINLSINLKTGPLVKLGLFRTNIEDYLMIVIHHLVVDGVSWRIMMEDFETGYQQAERGEEIKFQDKTDSFQYWAYKLKEYADSPKALDQLHYWKKIKDTKIQRLTRDYEVEKEKKIYKNEEVLSMELDEEETNTLLKEVNWLYNTEINDILLTALGMAVNEWCGNETVLINLEGHGREGIIEDIDISRTVGWFTSQYPLLLDMRTKEGEDLAAQIKKVKQTLRHVPNKGIGYGILNYLTSPDKKENITFTLQPEISFNYHGKLSGKTADDLNKKFHWNLGDSLSWEFDMDYALNIIGVIENEVLKLSIGYNRYEFDRSTILKFVGCFKSNLLKIINHCVEKKKEILALEMSAMDYHIKKDVEAYLEQIEREEWPDLTVNNDYKHILLTGATGFMGAHLVPELLENTNAILYLPVRGSSKEEAAERFKRKMAFYFGKDFFNKHKDRLAALRAELGEERLGIEDARYEELKEIVEAVVHPAANVKHHGLYEELYKDNVLGTEHLLEFAVTGKQKDFHYISTLDTGYGEIPGRDYHVFTEYCHDVGQVTDHIYLKSKFEAEKRVLAYREKVINGSIYRVGNLIFHSKTGQFQENIEDDYFYAIIRGAVKLEMLTDNMKKIIFDMSFIDYIAKSTVLLLKIKNLKNETHHLCNPHKLPMQRMRSLLGQLGFDFNDVKQEEVKSYLSRFEGNPEYEKIIELLKLHSWIFEKKLSTQTIYRIDRTVKLLKKLDFEWPEVTKEHIERMIAYCKDVGFI